jgi:hypothetical protein
VSLSGERPGRQLTTHQVDRVASTRTNRCCWRTNGKQSPTCSSTSRVRLLPARWALDALTLPTDRSTTNFFTGSPLAALTTLSFSDNVDLQRSAALAFAEITEKEVREVGRDTLDPVLYLLTSHDNEVQRAASAALGNLAVNRTLTAFCQS